MMGEYENGVYRFGSVRVLDLADEKFPPIGDDSLERAVARSFITDVLESGQHCDAFCRPCRFGKTLNMTMLKVFLEIPVDGVSRAPLFENMAIWDEQGGSLRAYQCVYCWLTGALKDGAGRILFHV